MLHRVNAIVVLLCFALAIAAGQDPVVRLGQQGLLEYQVDERGNRVPDFSYCGYQAGTRDLPRASPRVVVRPSGGDDTQVIQSAIDFVAQLPIASDGLRGAILLGKGEFRIAGQLRIRSSGIVLKGQGADLGADLGDGQGGTTLRATGRGRRALIRVFPKVRAESDRRPERNLLIQDAYVPVGTRRITLESTNGLAVGTQVEVVHPASKAWIDRLGIDRLGWREGTRDIRWERTIVAIEGHSIVLDVPLTVSIDKALCQGFVRVQSADRLEEIGVEDLALVSDYNDQQRNDEEHAWYGVHMQGVRDAWVRRVQFRHFAGGAVMLDDQTSRITVSDCASFAPVSEVAGYRRQTFFTLGQQCLFGRCWSAEGLHDFGVGHCAAGPNAFVNCYAKDAVGDSGPLESAANGVLYDNVRIEGHDLNLMNRWNSPSKAGWTAINCLLWQCQAANVRCDDPPVGNNWAIGLWANPTGDGQISGLSEFVKPISLFQQQLKERLGSEAATRVGPFLLKPVGATNPSIQRALEFTEQSVEPARELLDVVRGSWRTEAISADTNPSITQDARTEESRAEPSNADHRLQLRNGWLTAGGRLITGDYYTPMWWRGTLQPEAAQAMGPAVTRFAPGRYGLGLTDDLDTVARFMTDRNIAGYDHHYGLWYDRRRDDHLMVRRRDNAVVPPFYEQPFARSGQGQAWDGLSRYDLTKFNSWYWSRLRDFAVLGEQHGFTLFHHHYFQHNILEAGAHWADSPWRPANNINDVVLPEPPPYVGDKRIFLADAFYDESNSSLRALHRTYIRQCLNNFVGRTNVIQLTSGEYTGPLSFVQFWIDTIIAWEQETGNDVLMALSCTKDVQDAILDDPDRSPHVDVIDIRYWTYAEDGSLYAPPGGRHLSPRQHLRQSRPASTSFASVLRSVREYRLKFPDKPVFYNAHIHCRAKREGWAILIGGGSMPNVPQLPAQLAAALVGMQPVDGNAFEEGRWTLASDRERLIYLQGERSMPIQLPADRDWEWCAVDPKSGHAGAFRSAVRGAITVEADDELIWARSR